MLLHWADYLVLSIFLLISVLIGAYHAFVGGRQRTVNEFLLANRALGVLPTAISLLISFQSAILVLGGTAEMYEYGSLLLLMAFISYPGAILISTFVFVPWLYPLKLVSVYQYLGWRFDSRSVQILGCVLGMTTQTIYMGASMYAPSLALESASGVSLYISVPIMAAVAVLCTALGGMKAVIWADVFQSLVMVGGLITILIRGIIAVGGVGNVIKYCEEGGRLIWMDLDPNPTVRHTVWGFLFGHMVYWTNIYGLYQASVQRYSSVPSLGRAKVVTLLSVPGLVVMAAICYVIGLVVFAYYAMIPCDPLEGGLVKSPNQILAMFVVTLFQDTPGVSGLFLATLYGGALSSVSSALSGSAAIFWEDVLLHKFEYLEEKRKALINRVLVVIFGILATGMAFLASTLPGSIIQIMFALGGAVSGPLAGIFLLGGFTRVGNWIGALAGCIGATTVTIFFNVGTALYGIVQPTLPPVSTDGCHPECESNNGTGTTDASCELYTTSSFVSTPVIIDNITQMQGLTTESDGFHFSDIFYLSYIWYTTMGVIISFLIGYVVSALTSEKMNYCKDDDYLNPLRISCSTRNGKSSGKYKFTI